MPLLSVCQTVAAQCWPRYAELTVEWHLTADRWQRLRKGLMQHYKGQLQVPIRGTVIREAWCCCFAGSVNRQRETNWSVCCCGSGLFRQTVFYNKVSLKWIKSALGKSLSGLFCFLGPTCLPDWIEFRAWLTVFFLQSNVSMPKHWCVLWCVPDGSYLKSDKDLLRAWKAKWVDTCSCSMPNSADLSFVAFLAVCSNKDAAGGPPPFPALLKKMGVKYPSVPSSSSRLWGSFPWHKYGKSIPESWYHMEPVSKRTATASQIHQTPTRPHTRSDINL